MIVVMPKISLYRNDPKFLDRQVWANSIDPDHRGLQRLPFCLHLLFYMYGKATLLKF